MHQFSSLVHSHIWDSFPTTQLCVLTHRNIKQKKNQSFGVIRQLGYWLNIMIILMLISLSHSAPNQSCCVIYASVHRETLRKDVSQKVSNKKSWCCCSGTDMNVFLKLITALSPKTIFWGTSSENMPKSNTWKKKFVLLRTVVRMPQPVLGRLRPFFNQVSSKSHWGKWRDLARWHSYRYIMEYYTGFDLIN